MSTTAKREKTPILSSDSDGSTANGTDDSLKPSSRKSKKKREKEKSERDQDKPLNLPDWTRTAAGRRSPVKPASSRSIPESREEKRARFLKAAQNARDKNGSEEEDDDRYGEDDGSGEEANERKWVRIEASRAAIAAISDDDDSASDEERETVKRKNRAKLIKHEAQLRKKRRKSRSPTPPITIVPRRSALMYSYPCVSYFLNEIKKRILTFS